MSIALQSGKHFLLTNANSALGLVRMVISTHALSISGRGLLTAIYVLPNIIQMLGELGVSIAAIYFIGKKKYTEQEVTSTVFWSMFGLGLLYAVGMYIFSCLNPDMDPQGITETQTLR